MFTSRFFDTVLHARPCVICLANYHVAAGFYGISRISSDVLIS